MSWLVHLEVPQDDVEIVSSRLWSLGTTGIAELGANRMVAGFESQAEAKGAVSELGHGLVVAYDPSTIPSGEPTSVVFGSSTIALPNTDAFGHGAHPTTALALGAVLRLTKDGMTVLDMGCGTGVLAIGASLAGANALAIDNDPAAIQAVQVNAKANAVDLDVGLSLDGPAATEFDLILANMLLADLRGVAAELVSFVASGGVIAATGFLEDQVDQVVDLFEPLVVRNRRSSGDWVLLELSHPEEHMK